MSKRQPEHHKHFTNVLIAFFFFGALLFGTAGGIFRTESKTQTSLYQFSSAFFIAACSISGSKLTNEGWDIPAAGFTILAISHGIYYASLLVHPEERLPFFSSGVPLFLPSMVLIFYYKLFPLWLRILGLASCIPFLLILAYTLANVENRNLVVILFITGFILIDFTSLLWAYYFWKNHRTHKS